MGQTRGDCDGSGEHDGYSVELTNKPVNSRFQRSWLDQCHWYLSMHTIPVELWDISFEFASANFVKALQLCKRFRDRSVLRLYSHSLDHVQHRRDQVSRISIASHEQLGQLVDNLSHFPNLSQVSALLSERAQECVLTRLRSISKVHIDLKFLDSPFLSTLSSCIPHVTIGYDCPLSSLHALYRASRQLVTLSLKLVRIPGPALVNLSELPNLRRLHLLCQLMPTDNTVNLDFHPDTLLDEFRCQGAHVQRSLVPTKHCHVSLWSFSCVSSVHLESAVIMGRGQASIDISTSKYPKLYDLQIEAFHVVTLTGDRCSLHRLCLISCHCIIQGHIPITYTELNMSPLVTQQLLSSVRLHCHNPSSHQVIRNPSLRALRIDTSGKFDPPIDGMLMPTIQAITVAITLVDLPIVTLWIASFPVVCSFSLLGF